MEAITEGEANALLVSLLTSLRNTIATLGAESPNTASAREAVREVLLLMQQRGWRTDISQQRQSTAGEAMDVDDGTDEVLSQLVALTIG